MHRLKAMPHLFQIKMSEIFLQEIVSDERGDQCRPGMEMPGINVGQGWVTGHLSRGHCEGSIITSQ